MCDFCVTLQKIVAQVTHLERSKNDLTEDELSKAAMMEKYPDSNYPYDWLAWYKLRDVYRDFKAGKISKDLAADTKKSILESRQKEIDRNTEHFQRCSR